MGGKAVRIIHCCIETVCSWMNVSQFKSLDFQSMRSSCLTFIRTSLSFPRRKLKANSLFIMFREDNELLLIPTDQAFLRLENTAVE